MNFGNSIKKIAANINVSLRAFKATEGFKLNCNGTVLDAMHNKNASVLKKQLNPLLFCRNQNENIFFSFPKTDLVIKKSIIEPDQDLKIKVELPLSNIKNNSLELPFHIEKEIAEPSPKVVIIKKARHMLVIRRKKMKKHKKKKHYRKFRIQIQTREMRKALLEENKLMSEVQTIIQNSTNFSPDNYVTEKLNNYNWVRPVTRVRGRLAPDWVIKKHLSDEEEKKIFRERVQECVNAKK